MNTICGKMIRGAGVLAIAAAGWLMVSAESGTQPASVKAPAAAEPKEAASGGRTIGGETTGVVQVANLVYAGTKSSKCFSDHFLTKAEQDSSISTSRRFHAVKLADEELFNFPLVIMTGEGAFELTAQERTNLKRFLERGGFLLASASCSSPDWDRSFRAEMAGLFEKEKLDAIPMAHPIFHTVYDINSLTAKHGMPRPLEGVTLNGRIAVLYSSEGLNDTAHTEGCCCCGGNEILNCVQVNVNILAYAILY